MRITDLKRQLDFHVDAIYQKGYELGYETVLEDFEQIADAWWNAGFTSPAEMLRLEIRKMRNDNVAQDN